MDVDTKEYIIDKAFRLFLTHNYEAVSISVISDAIGLTKGALYHHFKNKEELFMAVIDKHFTFSGVSVDKENITLKEYTEACIQHAHKILTDFFKANEKFVLINYLSLIADSFRHYKNFASERFGFVDNQIDETRFIIDNAIKRGEIRSDIDTHVVALQYFSLSTGMAGDIIRNNSITLAINSLRDQLNQLYNLLKI